MPVEILQTALVHEAVIAHFVGFFTAGRQSIGHGGIYRCFVVETEGYEGCHGLLGIGNGFGGKAHELFVAEQHHVNVLAPHHAMGRLVRKLGVDGEAEGLIQCYRTHQIAHGQVDKNLLGHGS